MMAFKNIRIKMKGGKTRTQRVKVLKSGKYKFVKNLTKSRVKSTKKVKKRRVRRLARKKRRGGSRKFTLPIAPIAGLAAGLAPVAEKVMTGDYKAAFEILARNYTGYDPLAKNWKPGRMIAGIVPLIIGGVVHKYVGGPPLNINKMLAAANVPFIRI